MKFLTKYRAVISRMKTTDTSDGAVDRTLKALLEIKLQAYWKACSSRCQYQQRKEEGTIWSSDCSGRGQEVTLQGGSAGRLGFNDFVCHEAQEVLSTKQLVRLRVLIASTDRLEMRRKGIT